MCVCNRKSRAGSRELKWLHLLWRRKRSWCCVRWIVNVLLYFTRPLLMICKTPFCCLMSPSFVSYLLHIQVLQLKWTENFLGKYSKAQQKKKKKKVLGVVTEFPKQTCLTAWVEEKKKNLWRICLSSWLIDSLRYYICPNTVGTVCVSACSIFWLCTLTLTLEDTPCAPLITRGSWQSGGQITMELNPQNNIKREAVTLWQILSLGWRDGLWRKFRRLEALESLWKLFLFFLLEASISEDWETTPSAVNYTSHCTFESGVDTAAEIVFTSILWIYASPL